MSTLPAHVSVQYVAFMEIQRVRSLGLELEMVVCAEDLNLGLNH